MIIETSYMDDIPASTSSEEQSVRMTKDIEAILKPRGFRIKEWIFSGSTAAGAVQIKTESDESLSENRERVLGVQWNPGPDMLEFEINWPPRKGLCSA